MKRLIITILASAVMYFTADAQSNLKKVYDENVDQMAQIDNLKDLQKVSPGKTFTYEEVERWMRKMMV